MFFLAVWFLRIFFVKAAASWALSLTSIPQVTALVEDVSQEFSGIFLKFIQAVQGIFFCFILGIILLGIGLRRDQAASSLGNI